MAVSENDVLVGPLVPALGVSTISLDFYMEDATWIEVYKSGSETPLVLGSDYTVSGEGTVNGVVTLTTPANGIDAYSVYLAVPLERSSDMQLRGEFKSNPFNIEMDRIWQRLQLHWTILQRTLRTGRTATTIPPFVPVNDRVLGINDDGEIDQSLDLSFAKDAMALFRSYVEQTQLTFPLDLGLVSDSITTNTYDLGAV